MQRTAIESSNLASAGYEDGELEVEFRNGTRYRYADVPRETFDALMGAESKGGFFAREIRNAFSATRVNDDESGDEGE